MEVRMADHFGMCFGVRDAIDLALGLTRQGPLTILGDLVHNPDVVAGWTPPAPCRAAAGRSANAAVLLTAHGTADRVKLRLREGAGSPRRHLPAGQARVHLALPS